MGNETSRPLLTQDPGRNIWRNEKLTKDFPDVKVPYKDALRKNKHWKVLSKKDCSVAKLHLTRGNHIRYCHLPSALEQEQEQFSVQNWEICNPVFVEENNP
ncbi:hypothetical protein R3I93_004419 [Phoxinus phoxinus]|uniref:Uncharacterized protein n=1 Tax=Phoxinus phoxinus TaxID=58324 RepID=A0AAN9DF93_9TELE